MEFRKNRRNHHQNSCVIAHKCLRTIKARSTDRALSVYKGLSQAISRLNLAAIPGDRQGEVTPRVCQMRKIEHGEEGKLPKISRLSSSQEEERNQPRASGFQPLVISTAL